MTRVIGVESLPRSAISSRIFEGADHGGTSVTFFLVDQPPGGGPALHVHPYDEVFILQEGEATFTVGEESVVVSADQVVVAPAGQPHKFTNASAGPLRLVSIASSPTAITEWLPTGTGNLIRPATQADDLALHRLDVLTWSYDVSPAPPPLPDSRFLVAGRRPEDVLVAVVDTDIAGYVMLGEALPLASSRHVLEVKGLAVDPAHARRGLGRLLVMAAVREATARGARRLTLRVLGSNRGARALYESCGFRIEGILLEQFLLDGRYVDDILMAIDTPASTARTTEPG